MEDKKVEDSHIKKTNFQWFFSHHSNLTCDPDAIIPQVEQIQLHESKFFLITKENDSFPRDVLNLKFTFGYAGHFNKAVAQILIRYIINNTVI